MKKDKEKVKCHRTKCKDYSPKQKDGTNCSKYPESEFTYCIAFQEKPKKENEEMDYLALEKKSVNQLNELKKTKTLEIREIDIELKRREEFIVITIPMLKVITSPDAIIRFNDLDRFSEMTPELLPHLIDVRKVKGCDLQ